MTPGQFARVEELFFEAQRRPEPERSGFLAAVCEDPLVRAEVEALLGHEAGRSGSELRGAVQRTLQEVHDQDVGSLVGRRFGAYHIDRIIGHGGMGVVYRAHDTRLQRVVAAKAIPPRLASDPARLSRFLREARILASLSHPNIATVYGLEQDDQDTNILIMEFVEGVPLSDRLSQGPLSFTEALTICMAIAAGVEAAHEQGVIHRDLKPSNAMVTPEGKVKVLDFGLARTLEPPDLDDRSTEISEHRHRTQEGIILGTPGYMSPEQARGLPVDRRTDIFSFGCILYECLTGQVAFRGQTRADVLAAILEREPDYSVLPARTPPAIRRLLRRCLEKDPLRRMRDLGDARLELEDALEAREWTSTGERTAAAPTRSWTRVLPWTLAAIAMAVAGAVALRPAPAARTGAQPVRRFAIPFPSPQSDLWHTRVTLSRDGSLLAFNASDGSTQDLWLRARGDIEPRRLTTAMNAWSPFLSPDGEWIGYVSDGALMRQRLPGGHPEKITDAFSWFGASWGRNGAIDLVLDWAQAIARIPERGGEPKYITQLDASRREVAHLYPCVVPDRDAVLFVVWNGEEQPTSIHVVDLRNGQRKRVTDGGSPRLARTPDGLYLLWERSGSIFAAPFDVNNLEISGTGRGIIDGVLSNPELFYAAYDVADDGTLVYVPGPVYVEKNRLAWIGPDGTEPLNADRLPFVEPQLSRDGRKLSVILKGVVFKLHVYDFERKTFTRVIFDGDTTTAAISPDGTRVAYSANRDGRYGLYVRSLADQLEEQLMPGMNDFPAQLQWSPDGRTIAFSLIPPGSLVRDIYVLDVDGDRQLRQFYASPAEERQPSFSPDGKWLAYVSNEGGKRQVYIRSYPDGQVKRQISFEGGDDPCWSTEPGRLYYRNGDKLYLVKLAADGSLSGPPEVVFDRRFGQSDQDMRDYTVSPDGRILVVEPSENRVEIVHMHVVLNWYELLSERAPNSRQQ